MKTYSRIAPRSPGEGPTPDQGEMHRLVRQFDWARTPLGPIDQWPEPLSVAMRIMLASTFAMALAWGPELTVIYNDAYARMKGWSGPPLALGRPASEVWADTWTVIGPRIRAAFETGAGARDDDLLLFPERNGRREESYIVCSCSPLADDGGMIAGVLCILHDDTSHVIGERRLATLRKLAAELSTTTREADVAVATKRALAANPQDLPFTVAYLFDADRARARLVSATGVAAGHPAAPLIIERDTPASPWAAAGFGGEHGAAVIDDLEAHFAGLPTGAWNRPPTRAAVVSIAQTSRARPAGFLVVGLNPYRPFNEPYAAFLRLVAGQIGASLAHARTLGVVTRRASTVRASRERESAGDHIEWIVAHAPVAIAVLHGPDHVYTLANERYRRLVGARDLIGRPVREALSELAGQGVYEILDEVYRTGEPYTNDAVRLMVDEQGTGTPEEHFYDLSLQPLHAADGSVSGILVRVVDVTERLRARRRAEERAVELEQTQAALQAANAALAEQARAAEQARGEAHEANEAKSEFLAAMSHDLRTPLNAIGGYLQLIDMGVHGPVTEAQRAALARAQKSQRHLLTLINEVLNFAKLEAGRLEFDVGEVPVSEVVADVIPMIEPQLAAKGITYDIHVPPAAIVRADREKLRQILVNLLSNAVKFTEAGGHVTLDAQPCVTSSASDVCVSVADTGCGMPADRLPTIFDPFVQVGRNLTQTREGTGLGLAISRDLARAMDGDITVESRVGEGSTFTVRLPRGMVRAESSAATAAREASPGTRTGGGGARSGRRGPEGSERPAPPAPPSA